MAESAAEEAQNPDEKPANQEPGYEELLANYEGSEIPGRSVQNVLHGNFEILAEQPIPELDSRTARAYAVHTQDGGGEGLYAMVCETGLPYRLGAIQKLSTKSLDYIVNVIDSGVVYLSKFSEHRLVIIIERPSGMRLSRYIQQHEDYYSERFIAEELVTPVTIVLKELRELGISHGCINLDTIYYDPNREKKLQLGECVSELAGLSQNYFFETIDRSLCTPLAKGEGTVKTDCYALGIMILHLVLQRNPCEEMNEDDYLSLRLNLGTYNGLLDNREVPEKMQDILRGLLNDHDEDRWGAQQLEGWLGGKKFNLIRPSLPREAPRPYTLPDGYEYYNRKALANGIYHDWRNAMEILRNPKLIRWIELSVLKPDTAEKLREILESSSQKSGSTYLTEVDLQTSRALMVLDPTGPIRLRHLSVHADGLGVVLADFYNRGNSDGVQLIARMIESDLAEDWAEMQRANLTRELTQHLWRLQQNRKYIRQKGLGFGMERALYELNPALPCRSALLETEHIMTLKETLIALDRKAKAMLGKQELLDRHLAAFIASKLEIANTISISELQRFREFRDHPKLQMLHLLARAQKKIGNPALKGLSYWMGESLNEVLEKIHSRSLRKELRKRIRNAAKDGHLESMLRLFHDAEMLAKDEYGFQKAVQRYRRDKAEILHLSDSNKMMMRAKKRGIRFTMFLSYFLCLLIIFLVIKERQLLVF